MTTDNAELARVCYAAIGVFVPTVLVPAALLALATGIALGAGTKWGLLQRYWVMVELAISGASRAVVHGLHAGDGDGPAPLDQVRGQALQL